MPHFKRTFSQIVFVSLLLFLSGGVSYRAQAAQAIDTERSVPDGIFVGEPSTVTITAHIEPDPNLISSGVKVIRYDAAGRVIANLGKAYDDGTHGDVVAGDNVFSKQVTLNEPTPTTIYIRISAAYTGPFNRDDSVRRLLSNVFTIDVVIRPSEQDVTTILTTNQQATDHLDGWIQEFGIAQARQMLLNFLRSQNFVSSAGVSVDGASVLVVYNNGLQGIFPMNPPNTWGFPLNDRGLVFSAASNLADEFHELNHMHMRLSEETTVTPGHVQRDGQVSVEFIKTMYNYGVISFATHGGLGFLGNAVFQTGEQARRIADIPTTYLVDWTLKRLQLGSGNFWLVAPSFIQKYGGTYPDSIIFLSVCHSADNNSLTNAFLSKGVKTIFAWKNSVTNKFAAETKERILREMIDNNKTAGEAFDSVPHIDPYGPLGEAPAELSIAGSRDIKLPSYSVTDLGVLPGDVFSFAQAISNTGRVVGYSQDTLSQVPSPHYRAFLHSNGVMTDIGGLGGNASFATGINDSGLIVGRSANFNGSSHAFAYAGGMIRDLGTLGGNYSNAFGVNNLGQIVGQSQTATGNYTSFLYSNGVMTDIGGSNARGINDSGQVVGETFTGSGFHAYLYNNGSLVDLGTLAGDNNSFATAINNSGVIVGSSSSSNAVNAFIYSGGVMRNIGSLGGNFMAASDINDRGQVVGLASTSTGGTAFLYTSGLMKNLNRIIQPRSAAQVAWAIAINNNGQIVGYGGFNGSRALLLTPPR